ncbi:multidrug effflux MFS transporter [Polycladidibacter hongkongensis]|uniref:multidrug effflux MFS transporter n=1 Tax=Polycladidibacter hongkongensis TaxID=1647556 RepID=UPI000A98271D|nr:multidrug effflux MFS transporter [Pseudovibrio hongkongensis]
MSQPAKKTPGASPSGLPFAETLALVAALMALNALAIDVMLPALPAIGSALQIDAHNDRQLIITAFLIGMAVASLVFGPLSDSIGRRKVLLAGLAIYSIGGVISSIATSFEAMLAARFLQGIGAAAPRVATISMVRDWYSGREMGRVMSLAMVVFMSVPIVAPSIGQLILSFGEWRAIFAMLTIVGILLFIWLWVRLPESLKPQNSRPLSFSGTLLAYIKVMRTPITVGYMLAMSLILGTLFGFINSAQQVFVDVFGLQDEFPIMFALIASTMAAASFLNANLVRRFGMRKLAHGAMLAFTAASLVGTTLAATGLQTVTSFMIIQCLCMFFFGFIGSNCNAMAMEPMGSLAGAASSVISFFTTLIGAVLGALIGHAFNGSTAPLTTGFAVLGVLAIVVVYFTEGQRLFTPKNES